MLDIVAVLFIGYLLGSIPFGYLAGKLSGKDIRKHGSGNIGTTNALRLLGVGPALVVFALDIAKGFFACFIAASMVEMPVGQLTVAVAGLAAIAGHNWSVFLGFRGGKGAATTLGVFLYLAPGVLPIALSTTALAVILTRYMSLGSLMGTAVGAMAALAMGYPLPYQLIAVVAAVFSFWRHRGNIERLQRGEERRIGEKR